jgi:diguanylate cyclase (GGDEF)-like protein
MDDLGNQLIVKASQIISSTFKRSPVFRIGGDEFSVILQGKDFQERDVLFAKFKSECEKSFIETEDGKIPISVAQGFSIFDSTNDTEFSDVFNRADDEMYKNKKNMKELL